MAVFAALLIALEVAPAHADGHAVAVTSPAPASLTVEFYPARGGWKRLPGATPVLMLIGARDDWTPAAPYQALAQSASAAGRPVSIVVYPNAYHHFDGAEVRRRTMVSDARGGRGATVDYDPRAHEDSEKQVRAFLAAQLAK